MFKPAIERTRIKTPQGQTSLPTPLQMLMRTSMDNVRVFYLKLLSELGGVALRVDLQHLFVDEGELVNRDGGLSAQAGLQDSVMDEHILLLKHHSEIYLKEKRVTKNSPRCTFTSLLTVNCPLAKNNAEI